jgi:predicted Zn-dependent protease
MLGETRVRELLELALRKSGADQTEAVLLAEDSYLTRFANSFIHQNVAESNHTLSVRAVFGRRLGLASTNRLEPAEIKRTVDLACRLARIQQENKDFKSLPGPLQVGRLPVMFYEKTAKFSAAQRAEKVGWICDLARRHQAKAYGALSTGVSEVAVANSLGVRRYQATTDAYVNIVAMTDTGAGYGQATHRDVDRVDIEGAARKAVRKAVESRNPVELKPGRYPVVLEDTAAYTLLEFLNYTGFSARAVQEGRSFMGGCFGKRIMDPRITIIDDPADIRGFAFPFDFEGVPKQKVTLIEKGVARNVVYDSMTAGREGRKSTGHAAPAPAYHPMAENLVMASGDTSLKKMLESTKRGVYVTRFHYVNLIDPMEVSITGMTRDGTFLIENGKITKPLKNLRFTVSVLKCLNNLAAVGDRSQLVSEPGGYGHRFAVGSRVPALMINDFNFTGGTDF